VLRISREPEGRYVVSEVYLGLGDQLSASSVGAVRGNRLLIGGIFDPHFLDCRLE
jgi:hypothetical protein